MKAGSQNISARFRSDSLQLINGTNLHIGDSGDITFEGTTDDSYETTLTVVDPTADRTLSLPNQTGTLALTSDLTSYAPLAGATFTGDVTVNSSGTSGSANLMLNNSDTANNFGKAIEAFRSGITSGKRHQILLGKDGSNYDTSTISYYYDGSASTSNRLEFGFWGADALLNVIANGNVGIGTTAPAGTLHLHSADTAVRLTSSDGSNTPLAQLQYSSSGGYFLRMGDSSNNEDVMIRTYGNSHFNGGNVGIGTSSPSADYGSDVALEISGATSPGLVINDTGQGSKYGIHADSNDLKVTYGSNVLTTFQNDGDVGIGTTSPEAPLTVSNGGAEGWEIHPALIGSNHNRITNFNRSTSAYCSLTTDAALFNYRISGSGNNYMYHTANGLEVSSDSYNILNVRVDKDDNSTTNDGIIKISDGSSNTTKAEIRWDQSEARVHISSSDHGRHISIDSSGNVGVGTQDGTIGAKLHVVGGIYATGDVTAYYSSDINLKENVVNIENALDKVKQIRGVHYDWKDEYLEKHTYVEKQDVGVIAQEIEKVLPEIVADREDGTKAVKYDRLTALLIEAVKELSAKVDAQQEEINILKGK